MATPTIPNGEEYFFPIIYEGNGAGQRVGKFVPFTDNGTIDNSCIFNRADSAFLSRTPSSSSTSQRTFTISFWLKRGTALGTNLGLFAGDGANDNNGLRVYLSTSNEIGFSYIVSNSNVARVITTRSLEDTSKWYHIMCVADTTQATDSDRWKIYIDGDLQAVGSTVYPTQNYDVALFGSTSYPTTVARALTLGGSSHLDGYLAEYNVVDGTALTPDTFGVTDTSTGRWIPKTLSGITYGTNGFRLKFQDSSALGDDTSGNGNDFTSTNLASTDQTTDSPTQNHAVLASNPTAGTATLSEGNLKIAGTGSSVYGVRRATFLINSNDSNGYYFEAKNVGSSTDNINIGLISSQNALSASAYGGSNSYGIASRGSGGSNQYWRVLGGSTDVTTSVSHASDDVIGVAIKEGKIWFAINNTWVLSGDPANGTNSFFDMSSKASQFQIAFNVFQNNTLDVNFGQKSFTYTPPTGFSALQQDNLPETAKGISGLVWTKNRDASDNHQWYDSSRGNTAVITSVGTVAETTVIDGLQKFLAGGQQIEGNDAINTSGESFVSWNWVGNGATEVTNTEGSVTTTVQANTTAGFSILKFTPPTSGITDQTFGHGLTKAPEWFLFKRRDNVSTGRFLCFHKSAYDASNGGYSMEISSTNPNTAFNTELGASAAYPAAPTATTISMKNNSVLAGGKNHIAYCWHSVEGFSKFGKYVGNGSTDGPFIYTGFKPAWLMYKNINTASQWLVYDGQRNTFNPVDKSFRANASNVEETGTSKIIDFLSNGFKQRSISSTDSNQSGQVYIYMAFAEHPFVGDGTSPVTAR